MPDPSPPDSQPPLPTDVTALRALRPGVLPQLAKVPGDNLAVDPVLPPGRYVRVKELGRGGMSVVYHARDTRQGRNVALKACLPAIDDTMDAWAYMRLSRFRREATFAGLVHPNIIRIYDSGIWEDDGARMFTLVQELVEGRSLEAELKEQRAPGRADRRSARVRLLADFLRACEGMAYAHQQGVVHRDLKPANMLVVPDYTRARVLDFGLAKWLGRDDPEARGPATRLLDGALSMDGQAVGTPAYMSPEQAGGSVERLDLRTDVWSLGIVLFEILTLQTPAGGHRISEILLKVTTEDVPPANEFLAKLPADRRFADPVPRSLEDIVAHCLRRDPNERYPDAKGLLVDLERYLHSPQGALELVPAAGRRKYAAGEIIAAEGEPSVSMFVLERGRGVVVIEKGGWSQPCEEGFFGEAALVKPGHPRTATLRAGPAGCELIVVPDEAGLIGLLREAPLIGVQAIRELHSRRVQAESYYMGRIAELEKGTDRK